jgi:hypothetical protein
MVKKNTFCEKLLIFRKIPIFQTKFYGGKRILDGVDNWIDE